jgi:hypothetical protein
MKLPITLAAVVAVLACVAATFVQSKNPDEILKAINDYRTKSVADARSAGTQVDFAALNAEVTKMALAAIEGIDTDKVESSKAYSWAQIYSLAGKHEAVCDLCEKYLASNPSPDQKFAAQMLMLNSCNTMGEGDMLASTLPMVTAPDLMTSQALLRTVVSTYAGTIAADMGTEAAFKAIDRALAQVKYETPEDYAARMLPSYKARGLKNPDGTPMSDEQMTAQLVASGKSINDSLPYMAADKKASLLTADGKKDEALKVLKAFVAGRDPSSAYVRRANSAIKQAEVVGQPAIPLTFGRKYGDFESLDQWKGKVVIIDFTAHW